MWTLEFWVKQQHTAKLQALNFKENCYLVLSWALAWPSISYFDTLNHVMFLYFIHSSTELSKNFYHCQTFGLTQWKVLSDQTMFCRTRNMYYCKNIVNKEKMHQRNNFICYEYNFTNIQCIWLSVCSIYFTFIIHFFLFWVDIIFNSLTNTLSLLHSNYCGIHQLLFKNLE